MKLLKDCGIRLLAFDADDTLWDCQGHFDAVEESYCQLLAPYGSKQEVAASLFSMAAASLRVMVFVGLNVPSS